MNKWEILILGLIFNSPTALTASQQMDKVAAIVNNEIVLESDVQNMLKTVKMNARYAGHAIPNNLSLRNHVLDRLIEKSIILQIASQMQINIPEELVNDAISNIAGQNGFTIDQMKTRLKEDGIEMEKYYDEIRKEMLIAEVCNHEVRRRISILPVEIESLAKKITKKSAYEANVNLSHILIPLPEHPTQVQLQQSHMLADKIMDELKKNIKFEKFSIASSLDSKAFKVINIGWSRLEELPTIFVEKLKNSKKYDIVGPIRSGVGYHILCINDINNENKTIFATEVKARHIFIKLSPMMNDAQARQKLMEIYQDISIGKTTFEDAAKKNSDDLSSAFKGGELEWNTLNVYDPKIRNALIKLNKGEISQPIPSNFGWHLIQLQNTRNVDKTNASKNDQAYRLLFDRKFNEETQSWIEEQRAAAYVNVINSDDYQSNNDEKK